MPVIKLTSVPSNTLFPSAMASGSAQSSLGLYGLSSCAEEYLTPENVAKTTPGQRDRAAHLLTGTRPYLNSLPESPKNWGQVNPNLNDYRSDPMQIGNTFWILDITDWWCQQGETHLKYANLSNMARDIVSIIPHGPGVEASSSLWRDDMGWRKSNTTSKTHSK